MSQRKCARGRGREFGWGTNENIFRLPSFVTLPRIGWFVNSDAAAGGVR